MKDVESLVTNIKVCDKHVAMMNAAITDTKQLFPISVKVLKGLSNTSLYPLETLIARFAKLQDTIAQKIFPLIIKLFLEKDPDKESFANIVNTMEKIGALESKNLWNRFRDTRNSITHDYPDQPERTCEELNLCMYTSLELISYWQFLRKFIDDKVLVHYKTEASSV
jgi:hypothetical protein